MPTPKKYVNNVDSGARHHYDVYELIDEKTAHHIAPFTQEWEAQRVAEALAALDIIDEGVAKTSKYVVRARATSAHNIHRHDAKSVKRNYGYLNAMRIRMMDLMREDEPTKTSVG